MNVCETIFLPRQLRIRRTMVAGRVIATAQRGRGGGSDEATMGVAPGVWGGAMGSVLRSLYLAALAIVAAASLTITVQLTATTALIMGGTEHPLVGEPPDFVGPYTQGARDLYIAPTGAIRADSTDPNSYHLLAVATPEQFWPVAGASHFDSSVATGVANLTACLQGRSSCKADDLSGGSAPPTSDYVVYGYSQSARIATIVKRNLIASELDFGDTTPDVSFVVASNPNRPNGGFLERFAGLHIPILDVTFDGATPTDSCDAGGTNCRFLTVDIARQYDGWADFPRRPPESACRPQRARRNRLPAPALHRVGGRRAVSAPPATPPTTCCRPGACRC